MVFRMRRNVDVKISIGLAVDGFVNFFGAYGVGIQIRSDVYCFI